MSKNRQLLKIVRNTIESVRREHTDPYIQATLSAADIVLNELMLQDNPAFYLDYAKRGSAILAEGKQIFGSRLSGSICFSGLRENLGSDLSSATISQQIDNVTACLTELVAELDEGRSIEEKAYLERVCAWEKELYDHRLVEARTGATIEDRFSEQGLLAYLRRKFPHWPHLRITRFQPVPGGYSKKTILFSTEDDVNGAQHMVLRADQAASMNRLFSTVAQEFYIVQYMRNAGLPVPEPLWLEEDPRHFGEIFLVSRQCKGNSQGILAEGKDGVSPNLIGAIVKALAAFHNVPVDVGDPILQRSQVAEWLPFRTMRDATTYYVTEYLWNWVRATNITVTPQLVRALNWLKANVPDSDQASAFLHIDFGLHNLLTDEDEVTAILDLESVMLGDPAADIIVCHDGLSRHISLDDFLDLYAAASGHRVSHYRIAYMRVVRATLYSILFSNAGRILHGDDNAHIKLATVYYRVIGVLGGNFNELIAAAEKLRHAP